MDSSFNVAVHALVYLHHKDCLLSSEALAENICTNPAPGTEGDGRSP